MTRYMFVIAFKNSEDVVKRKTCDRSHIRKVRKTVISQTAPYPQKCFIGSNIFFIKERQVMDAERVTVITFVCNFDFFTRNQVKCFVDEVAGRFNGHDYTFLIYRKYRQGK